MELHGTRLRLPEDSKPYPLRLKKCQASHARHNERMLIMRRRSASGATAARVASLSMGGRCRGVGWISVKWGAGYERATDKWGMGVCSGRRPSGRRWGMGVCRPGNTPARGGYGRYEAIQPDFAPETGARRRNFRPQCITSDDFPRLDPPPLSRLRPGPPPLSALSVRRRDHPPWSRYLESIFTIWENGTTRRCASK